MDNCKEYNKLLSISHAAAIMRLTSALLYSPLPVLFPQFSPARQFLYGLLSARGRSREYEDALEWLVDARLVHKIYRSTAPGLPVAAYDDLSAFQIYLVDVGPLRRLAKLAPMASGKAAVCPPSSRAH